MNAPLRIQIDDATKRKADCWERAQEGEIDALEAKLIDDALSFYAEHMAREASRLDTMSRQQSLKGDNPYIAQLASGLGRASRHYNVVRSQVQSLRDKFQDGGNAYIMPGDA